MTWSGIRDEVQTILAGVTGIGQVHNRFRAILTDRDLKSLMVSSGVINGWQHSRIGTSVERLTNLENLERHIWMIRGWYSFKDAGATEATFQQLIEDIRATFRGNAELNNSAELAEPPQLVENSEPHVMIPPGDGGILCHFAELRMVIQELIPTA